MRSLLDIAAMGISRLGYGVLRLGSIRLAGRLFHLAHRLNHRYEPALRLLAWCLRESGDLDGALEYYQQLVHLRPSFVQGRVECGFVLGGLARYPEAIDQFDRALEESPEDSVAQTGLAAMLMATNHYAQAIPLCERLVRNDPANSVAWGFLARARAEERQWEAAIAAYETACRLDANPQVAAEHAGVLMELERYHEAEAVLKRALATHARSQTLTVQLAAVFLEQRRYVEAENALKEILEADPMNSHARQVLASLWSETGRASEATATAQMLVREFPDDPRTHATAGHIAIKGGRWQDALAAFENASQIEVVRPPSGVAKVSLHTFQAGRAVALKALGRSSEARTIAMNIVEQDPTFLSRHVEYAELALLVESTRDRGPNL